MDDEIKGAFRRGLRLIVSVLVGAGLNMLGKFTGLGFIPLLTEGISAVIVIGIAMLAKWLRAKNPKKFKWLPI